MQYQETICSIHPGLAKTKFLQIQETTNSLGTAHLNDRALTFHRLLFSATILIHSRIFIAINITFVINVTFISIIFSILMRISMHILSFSVLVVVP